MVAHAMAFADIATTGQRPVSATVRQLWNRVTGGGRLVQTKRGYALFNEDGKFVGMIDDPVAPAAFGPARPTVLLNRDS